MQHVVENKSAKAYTKKLIHQVLIMLSSHTH